MDRQPSKVLFNLGRWFGKPRSCPAGRTPKTLYRVCAEKIANMVATRALPAIELYLAEDEFYHNYYFPNKTYILVYLHKMRTWFWNDVALLFGRRESLFRIQINYALSDVLDYHSEVMEGPRDQQLFTLFIFQLLFQYHAGNLTTGQSYAVDHMANNLERLLERVGSLEIGSLHFKSIVFCDPKLLCILLKFTPRLTTLQLHECFDESVMTCLRENCPKIKDLELEVPANLSVEAAEEALFNMFFWGLNKQQVLSSIERYEDLDISFPCLKCFYLYSRCEHIGPVLDHLIFVLQFLYPSLKTKWYRSIKDQSLLPSIVKSGIPCTSFLKGKDNFHWSALAFQMGNPAVEETTTAENLSPVFLKANHISVTYNQAFIENPHLIYEILRKFNCCRLKLDYSTASSGLLTKALGPIGPYLKELYLTGPLLNMKDGIELYTILHNCGNLVILGLKLDLVHDPKKVKLHQYPKLEVLSLKVNNYPHWKNFPIKSSGSAMPELLADRVNGYIDRFIVSKHMPLYLERFGRAELGQVNRMCNRTGLDIYSPDRVGVNKYNGKASHNASSLSDEVSQTCNGHFDPVTGISLITDKIFGSGVLKYDVPEKGTDKFGYGVLEHRYFNGSSRKRSAICGYRTPAFTFYGNKYYGYCLNGSDFVGYGSYIYRGRGDYGRKSDYGPYSNARYWRSLQIYTGDVVYNSAMYGDLKKRTKERLIPNVSREASENMLRQWRHDMDFNAPTSLLRTLLCAAPNLGVLEIPDIKVTDVNELFDEGLIKYLYRLHTLHLSTQFSTILAETITKFPALQFLRVDPQYGIDNFLRFKKSLCSTSLRITCMASSVRPMSEFDFL